MDISSPFRMKKWTSMDPMFEASNALRVGAKSSLDLIKAGGVNQLTESYGNNGHVTCFFC